MFFRFLVYIFLKYFLLLFLNFFKKKFPVVLAPADLWYDSWFPRSIISCDIVWIKKHCWLLDPSKLTPKASALNLFGKVFFWNPPVITHSLTTYCTTATFWRFFFCSTCWEKVFFLCNFLRNKFSFCATFWGKGFFLQKFLRKKYFSARLFEK